MPGEIPIKLEGGPKKKKLDLKTVFIFFCVFLSIYLIFWILRKNIIYRKNLAELKKREEITVKVYTSKKEYYRYELIKVYAKLTREVPYCKMHFKIYYKNEPLITVGELFYNKMEYDKRNKLWVGTWPVPWDAKPGKYKVEVKGKFFLKEKKILLPFQKYVSIPLLPWIKIKYPTKRKEEVKILQKEIKKEFKAVSYFKIISKHPPKIPKGFSILDIEVAGDILKSPIITPCKKIGNWKNIYDWAEFMGVDAVFYIVGQTSLWKKYREGEGVWVKENLECFPHLAKEARKRGFKFGGWIGCYLSFGKYRYPYYKYNYNYSPKTKSCYPTMSISFKCERRKQDIIKLMKMLDKNPDVSFIGLDYIRLPLGGYELVDEFVNEMKPDVPADFFKMSYSERMKWLGEKITSKEPLIYEQWNWWRAHKIALLVKELIEKSKVKKPVWVFTLGWEHGKQHGQDPLMLQDAGISFDCVMLYECPKNIFPYMIASWREYLRGKKINIFPGNMIDWFWHQNTLIPAGPEEFYLRLKEGIHNIRQEHPAEGIFIHDLGRLLWGRTGPYPKIEWAIASGCAITELKETWKVIPFKTEIFLPDKVAVRKKFSIRLEIKNQKKYILENLKIKSLPTEGVVYYPDEKIVSIPPLQKNITVIEAELKKYAKIRGNRFMIAFEISSSYGKRVIFKYVQAE